MKWIFSAARPPGKIAMRYIRFAGGTLSQQSLADARRTYQENAFRQLVTKFFETRGRTRAN